MQKRTYLTITRDDRKAAMRAAGKMTNGENSLEYDPEAKLWFAREQADLERVKAWLPGNAQVGTQLTTETGLSPQEEFRRVLEDAGFDLSDKHDDHPVMDGEKHRVATKTDSPGQKSGVYRGFLNGRPAGWYQDFRASEDRVKWISSGKHTMDPAEQMQHRALAAQNRWDKKIALQKEHNQLAEMLTRQWEKMPPAAADNAYLVRKGLPATESDARADRFGNLVIPLRNETGAIRTLQYIQPDGTKILKKNAEKMGNYFVAGGPLKNGTPVLYAEGYATAVTLNMATNLPVVMTVDAGNLVTVSQKLSALYPQSAHVICGEDDFTNRNTRGELENKGVLKAQEAAEAIGGTCVFPRFTDEEKAQAFARTASFSDFNDIHAARGLDAVREQLAPVLDHLMPGWHQEHNPENPSMTSTTEYREGPSEDDLYYDYLNELQRGDVQTQFEAPQPVTEAAVAQSAESQPAPDATVAQSAEQQPAPDAAVAQPEELQPASEATVAQPEQPQPVPEAAVAQPEEPQPAPDATIAQSAEPQPVPEAAVTLPEESQPAPEAAVAQPEESQPVPDAAVAQPEQPQPASEATVAQPEQPQPVPETAVEQPEEPQPVPENALNFTFGRQPGDTSPPDDTPVPQINLDELIQGLTSRKDGRTWVYSLDGQDAFRDYGDRILMASPEACESDRMILAALLCARANQRGAVEITGTPEFIEKTLGLIAEHNVDVHLKNPAQRAQFEALMQARAENKQPDNAITLTPEAMTAQPAPVTSPDSPAPAEQATHAPGTESPAAERPAAPETPPMSVIERETLRVGINGTLVDAGPAPYKFDPNNGPSYYVKLRTKKGEKDYWGVELKQALMDSGKQVGDMVKLQFLGKTPVTVNLPVRDEQGVVTGYKPHETHRNQWNITAAVNDKLLVADKNTVAPAELSAYDGNAFWALQHRVVAQTGLSLEVPVATGHGLLYSDRHGKGRPAPEQPPANAPVPSPSAAAGSAVMSARDDNGRLLAHLVKGHGDYLQGVILHENEMRHVLARLCKKPDGESYLALNTLQPNGNLKLIGHASPVNQLRGADVNYDTFAFQLKGKDTPKFAVPLVNPGKIPPALHSKLGFTQAYTPPEAKQEPAPVPRQQVKPAMQPQPM